METPNPYESPHEVNETTNDERFVRRYLPLLASGLAGGLLLSAYYPVFGVPFTLIATPAMVRATRIYWRTLRASLYPDWTDWCGFFFASVAVVLPISFVGGFAFCCVCTAGGIIDFNLNYPVGNQKLSMGLMYGAIYLGLAAGLLASLFLLKRLNYLSAVEKIALEQRAASEDQSLHTDEALSDDRLQQGHAESPEDDAELNRGTDGGGSG